MPNEELQKRLNQMVEKAIRDLNINLAKADHLIIKLTTISRYEGYGIALHELGADTTKLGTLVESEAKKIEPSIRPLFK
jgi:hypothetical protein